MFDDLIDDADEYLYATNLGKHVLEELLILMEKLSAEISLAERSLESLESPVYVQSVVETLILDLKEISSDVLQRELAKAISKREEFNYKLLSEPLLEVALEQNLIQIRQTGNGWDTSIRIMLDLNRVAGTLEDWAMGVAGARQAVLGKKPKPYDPVRASKYWREKVYGLKDSISSYKKTIQLRLMYAGTPAPYWQLLDQGTTELDSDRGGEAYPVNKPTHFVRKTKSSLRKYFTESIVNAKNNWTNSIKELKVTIRTGMEYWNRLNELYLDILNGDGGDWLDDPDGVDDPGGGGGGGGAGDGDNILDDDIMRRAEQELNSYKGRVDYYKVEDVLTKLALDLPVPITSEGRIEVTASGSSSRVRPHVNVFLAILGK